MARFSSLRIPLPERNSQFSRSVGRSLPVPVLRSVVDFVGQCRRWAAGAVPADLEQEAIWQDAVSPELIAAVAAAGNWSTAELVAIARNADDGAVLVGRFQEGVLSAATPTARRVLEALPSAVQRDSRLAMATTITPNSATQFETRVRNTRYAQGEVVALARLILRDSRLNVIAGSEWAYIARAHTLTYPVRVLDSWNGTSVVGAICQQMAEAEHTGVMGERALQSFSRIAPVAFAAVMPFARLVNELRVNRMHLQRHPGSARFLRALYADNPQWSSARRRSTPLREQVQQGLMERWLHETWPEGVRPMHIGSTANRYVDVLWPGVRDALQRDALPQMLDVLARRMLPILNELIEDDSRRAQDRPGKRAPRRRRSCCAGGCCGGRGRFAH